MSIKQQSCVETMKQALEALELNMAYSQTMNLITGARASQETFKAITSLCQAIARAEGTLEAEKQASWSGDPSTQDYASTQQEPVAYANDDWSRIDFPSNKVPTKGGPLYTSPLQRCPNCDSLERQNAELDLRLAEQEQPPFGFLTNRRQRFNFEPNMTGLQCMPMTIDWKIPLYGSPQPQHQPLTDEQIDDLRREYDSQQGPKNYLNFARAIEAAHGIMSVPDGKEEA